MNFIGADGLTTSSGRIADDAGRSLAGINVYRSGRSTPAVTNSAGYYSFINVPDGSVVITPSDSSRVFLPPSRTITINGADITNQNFTGAIPHKIIGRISTSNGAALAGVTVTRSGSSTPVITNSAGYYVFSGVVNGSYIIMASKAGVTFMPMSKTVAVKDGDASGQNFIGTN